MPYLIDNRILYEQEDGSLSLQDVDGHVTLPLPARRLLELLLNSHGEILTRDYLFQEVWDKYGYKSSNSNLNQYMSVLRRSFSALGCEDFILTIPTVGVKIKESIEIVEIECSPSFSSLEVEKVEIDSSTPTNIIIKKDYFLYLLATLPAVIALVLFISVYNQKFLDPKFRAITIEGGCELLTQKPMNTEEINKTKIATTSLLKDNHLPCRTDVRIYFDSYKSFSLTTWGRTMFSYCLVGGNGSIYSCENMYFSDWSKNENK